MMMTRMMLMKMMMRTLMMIMPNLEVGHPLSGGKGKVLRQEDSTHHQDQWVPEAGINVLLS